MTMVTVQLKAMAMHLEGEALVKFLADRGVYVTDPKDAILYRCQNDEISHEDAVEFCKTNKIEFVIST